MLGLTGLIVRFVDTGLRSDCLRRLDKCVASVIDGRRERNKAEEDWRRVLSTTRADYEARIKVGALVMPGEKRWRADGLPLSRACHPVFSACRSMSAVIHRPLSEVDDESIFHY